MTSPTRFVPTHNFRPQPCSASQSDSSSPAYASASLDHEVLFGRGPCNVLRSSPPSTVDATCLENGDLGNRPVPVVSVADGEVPVAAVARRDVWGPGAVSAPSRGCRLRHSLQTRVRSDTK